MWLHRSLGVPARRGVDAMCRVVALPRSKWQTMKLCIISSLCEPLAAIVFGLAFNSYLTRYAISALNAAGTPGNSWPLVLSCCADLLCGNDFKTPSVPQLPAS